MNKRQLVITAVLAGQSQSEVARRYEVSQGWISKLMARYDTEGQAAFYPRSTRPHTSPNATPQPVIDLITGLRQELTSQGHDAGAETICWHLEHAHAINIDRATIHRILTRQGLIIAQPAKRPRSSYIRFQAEQPNECWQSDVTHYRLTKPNGCVGPDTEIITWLDDHSRKVLHLTAHPRLSAPLVTQTFRATTAIYGLPASTLTDNGMIYTVRLAGIGRQGGRTSFEAELHKYGIIQKNGKPHHPQTQGKVERFQQTLKKWLRAQPAQPTTITELQALLDRFVDYYNNQRPHRSLPHRSTPAAAYQARIKATPPGVSRTDTHDRVRRDIIDTSGVVTLRVNGKLHHIGIGRTHARTHIIMLIQDLDVTIVHAITGEILRELTIDTSRDYQPITPKQK